ncbi:MAG TPA: hypothetical protein DDZ41_06275 [Flavobacterium sp.]|nr:hypothetical protein [Flavobacterium sp.]
MNANEYLKTLIADKNAKFEVLLELQNEGKLMNYWESYERNLEQIIQKAQTIISGLKQVLPKGKFEVKIEDIFEGNTFVYVDEDKFYVNKNINAILEIS